MNVNRTNSQPNFTSSIIPYTSTKPLSHYFKTLDKYFTLKGFGKESPEALREKIDFSQAAIGFDKKGMLVVGKDKSDDRFIGRVLKEIDPDVKFIDDAPEIEIDGPVIDLFI